MSTSAYRVHVEHDYIRRGYRLLFLRDHLDGTVTAIGPDREEVTFDPAVNDPDLDLPWVHVDFYHLEPLADALLPYSTATDAAEMRGRNEATAEALAVERGRVDRFLSMFNGDSL